jgi:ribonuclease Z
LIAAGGKLFLFDAGENAMRNLETNHVPLAKLENIFITHWHSDHFNGLGGVINHTWVNGRTQPLTVYGPPGVVPVVKGLSMAYALDASYRHTHFVPNEQLAFAEAKTIVIPQAQESVRVYEQNGVTIDAYRVNHFPVDPAYGYVLRYQGKKIFVSGDTRVTDIYQDALQDADLVIHEALNTHMIEKIAESMERQGLNQKASDARKVIEYHSDTLELASLAEKAKVKHLVLTHLIPAPPNFIAKYLFVRGMADRFNGEITLGEDALEIDL